MRFILGIQFEGLPVVKSATHGDGSIWICRHLKLSKDERKC